MPHPRAQIPKTQSQDERPGWGLGSGDVGFGILGALGFLHARRLALQLTQVVQLRAADSCGPNQVDLGNGWRVQREDALDTLAERHLADRKRRAHAAAMQSDDDALEDLDAFLVALAHLDVHPDGVARLHVGPFGHLRLFELVYYRAHLIRLLARRADKARPPFSWRPSKNRPAFRQPVRAARSVTPSVGRPC